MARVNRGRPFRVDKDMHPMPGGEAIVDVLNVALTNSTWAAVQLPSGVNVACKSILAKLRTGASWRLSHLSAGTRYMTVTSDISIDLAQDQAAVLFYAQSVAASGTLEVMLLD